MLQYHFHVVRTSILHFFQGDPSGNILTYNTLLRFQFTVSYIIYVLQIYSFKLGIANIQIEILFCECMKWPTRLDLNYVCAYNFLPNPLILIYCFSCSVETFLFAKHFVCFKYSISPKTVRETVLRLQKVKPFAFACLRVANNLFLCILDFLA